MPCLSCSEFVSIIFSIHQNCDVYSESLNSRCICTNISHRLCVKTLRKDLTPALHVECLTSTGARSNKLRSPASHISVFAFGRKKILITLSITCSLAHAHPYSNVDSQIFPFTRVQTLPGEWQKALPVANSKHFFSWSHGIYSKTQLQMFKLSSQNVHVTRLSVFHVVLYVICVMLLWSICGWICPLECRVCWCTSTVQY